ncbi:MAG: hypothetical protein OK457_06720, partial [Thaumarchaeota archaeon]|nr:hypothetical protein [Nitrososphaerota archaeon]
KYNEKLTPECKQVLENRRAASSTSYTKLAAILRQVCPDNRLRNQLVFMGSPRCGRWAGNAVQLHNMARPIEIFEDEVNVDRARALIRAEDYEGIQKEFGSVLLTVKYNIRTSFVAEEGDRFNVCDLKGIETCVGAWMSECTPLLNVYLEGRDAYLDFAVKMTQIPYETLEQDIHSKDKAIKARAKKHRQIAKPAVLGCIYRLGGGQMGMKKGDPIKQGLWGYAEGYGVSMTQEQAHETVRVFRESYIEIVKMWFALEKAIKEVLEGTQVKRELGPNGCIKIDKLTFTCNETQRCVLRIQLPSGRFLHYMDAMIDEIKMPWQNQEGDDVYKPSFCYAGQDQTTKQWSYVTSHGGKVFENIDQGISRDVLANKLLRFEQEGLPVVGHVHDEGISETEDHPFAPGLNEMIRIMGEPIDWAPGLPLGSDGFEGSYYHK